MARRRRLMDLTVEQAARALRDTYGDRAEKVASDRYDMAGTEPTAEFYSAVHHWLRNNKRGERQ